MTATATKITYTSTGGDLEEFHRLFDEALARARANAGRRHPFYIDHRPIESSREPIVDRSPIDTSLVLGTFDCAGPEHVEQAVRSAKQAQRAWGRLPWQERVATMRKAAELIRERKYDLAAIMALEVGKNRLEAMGDVEESADL
ncbi:MAG TPA: aldehyde dehydrogenase family protein, partial [Gemmatimonadales bacterium]|nr:aldehyde dehydrogenase family protein [Gemmatimonadales bacterium]